MSLRKGHSHQQMRKHQIGFEQPCCSECCKISPFSDKDTGLPIGHRKRNDCACTCGRVVKGCTLGLLEIKLFGSSCKA